MPAADRPLLDLERDPNGQQRKLDFLERKGDRGIYNPHALQDPVSAYQVLAGTVIAASLLTGLNSDLPGLVTAQVTENVYDTVTGTVLLIPQGSRLIGSYDSVVAYGQRRALVAWQRLIMP
ncbi:MAG: TrbI/VirB10 family protein, partial [Magnetospirillum sp.]|nr:TrbI/VirB10 family protein [Magnetospirillum sp.]